MINIKLIDIIISVLLGLIVSKIAKINIYYTVLFFVVISYLFNAFIFKNLIQKMMGNIFN
jgi:hypothetical protein